MSFLTRRRQKQGEKDAERIAASIGLAWTNDLWWVVFQTAASETGAVFITHDQVIYARRQLAAFGENSSAAPVEALRVRRDSATATVDTSGNFAIKLGWGYRANRDTRQCHLTVEGSGDPIVIPMQPQAEHLARVIAARINARHAEPDAAER